MEKDAVRELFSATSVMIYLSTNGAKDNWYPMYEPADLNGARWVRFGFGPNNKSFKIVG